MIPGPNFSAFSIPRPWMDFSCVRFFGRARTMLRSVAEARTKKRGTFSFSDSALRQSRRRWSRACCSGVRLSVGSGMVGRGRVKVSAEGWLIPRGKAPFSLLPERPKAEALGYLDATVSCLDAAVMLAGLGCDGLERGDGCFGGLEGDGVSGRGGG